MNCAYLEFALGAPDITSPTELPCVLRPLIDTHDKPVTFLYNLYRHPRDQFLIFYEPTHTYTNELIETSPIISVTTFIKYFFNEFDAKNTARRIALLPLQKQKKEVRGMSEEEILTTWELKGLDARTKGTEMHLMIEHFLNCSEFNRNGKYFLEKTFEQLRHFMHAHRYYRPYRTEWMVWSDIGIVGTIDAVFVHPKTRVFDQGDSKSDTLYLSIFDWKRSNRITRFAFNRQCGKGALSHVPDSNFHRYSVQLNIYTWIIETYYKNLRWNNCVYKDVKIVGMYLVAMHDSAKNYKKLEVSRFSPKIIEAMIESHTG